MKKRFLFSILCCVASQVIGQHTTKDVEKINWLQGQWTRLNTKPGRTGTEYWKKISSTEWIGKGITMKGSDTVFVEKMKIVLRENCLYYVADVPENKSEVYFKFTAISAEGFTCENPTHDFPKKIVYHIEPDNRLKASISGDGKTIDYFFEKGK